MTISTYKNVYAALGTIILMSTSVALAPVAGAETAVLEEIVVEARRRSENLQEVPIAVTAFQGYELESRDIGDISVLSDTTPNVSLKPTASLSGASNASAFFIRGVGQTDFAVTTDPGVGVYLDGVYIARSVGGVLDTLDVESIEILRGPQGTLFGRNTIGGAINVRSRRPADELSVDVNVTVGSRDRRQYAGALDLPLTDRLSARLSFLTREQDGYVKRLVAYDDGGILVPTGTKSNAHNLSDEQGNADSNTIRVAFDMDVTDSWNLYLSIDNTDIDEESAASTAAISSMGLMPDSALTPIEVPGLGLVSPGDPRLVTGDPDTTYATGPNGTDVDIDGITLISSWSFANDIQLESITAFRTTQGRFNRDGDGTPFPIGEQTRKFEYEQFSQELKLNGSMGNIDWTTGLYFLTEDSEDLVFVSLGNLFGPPPSIDIDNYVDNESVAVYAQGTWRVSEKLGVTGGLRWTRDDKEYETSQIIPVIPLTVVDGSNDETFDAITGRLGFEYRTSDELMYYFSASRGFKSGGFTPRYVAPVATPLPFDEETVDSYELGFKWENDRARVNVAAFTSGYDDIQLVLFDSFGAPINQNGGDATLQGIEVEGKFLVNEIFRVSFTAGWLDSEFDSVLPPTALPFQPITENSEFPNSPELQVSMSPELVFPVAKGEVRLRLDWIYSDDVHQTFENDPELLQDSYDLVDVSISYINDRNNWSVTLGGHNLSNERIIVSGGIGRVPGFGDANYNKPREWYLRLQKEL